LVIYLFPRIRFLDRLFLFGFDQIGNFDCLELAGDVINVHKVINKGVEVIQANLDFLEQYLELIDH
jgi:hypothetical protein